MSEAQTDSRSDRSWLPSVGRATVLALVAFLTVPIAASGYKVFLKDGTAISAQDEYVVQGEFALVTLESGTQTTIHLDEVDVERTAEYNAQPGYSGAIVINQDGRTGPLAARDDDQSLTDLIRSRRGRFGARDGDQPEDSALRRTPAGYVDLSSVIRRPLDDRELLSELNRFLRDHSVTRASVYKGTRSDRILVEVITESEGAVLQNLTAVCRTFVDFHRQRPAVNAIEVLMQTGGRSRAGQFVLTEENAPLLASGRLSASDFFLEHVQF